MQEQEGSLRPLSASRKAALEEAVATYSSVLMSPAGVPVGQVLNDRGIDPATARAFRLEVVTHKPEWWNRFWSKVEFTDSCWTWARTRVRGYGQFSIKGVRSYSHRLAYELLVGPIPEGLVLDHLCRNTACVNPQHLEPVSQKVNVDRGELAERQSQLARAATHCRNGHRRAGNTYTTSQGYTGCTLCLVARRARGRAA